MWVWGNATSPPLTSPCPFSMHMDNTRLRLPSNPNSDVEVTDISNFDRRCSRCQFRRRPLRI